jgi:hypothetical protein
VALGFIGPAIKGALSRYGYVVTRPTEIEKMRRRSYWEQWFSHDPALFANVYALNRKTLRAVPDWAPNSMLEGSLWRYGVPTEWVSGTASYPSEGSALNAVDDEITAADILSFIARFRPDKLSYLEIGVSVGKNLLQISRQVTNSVIVGLDVEELSPILRSNFDTCDPLWRSESSYPVETLSRGKIEKAPSCVRLTSIQTGNTFDYISADQFRDDTWARLGGHRFNMVFSDGVHTPQAIQSELQFLMKHDLLDRDRLVVLWDDLFSPDMQLAFLHNAQVLCRHYERDESAISLYVMNGSYGPTRPMGMFAVG